MGKKKVIGLALIVFCILALFLLLASYFVLGGAGIGSSDKNDRFWNECQVTIDEKTLGSGVTIQSASCENTGKKCNSLFALFSNEGTVEMWDASGKIAAEDYKTGLLGGDDEITIRGCSADDTFDIRVYDEDHNLQEKKTV